MISSCPLTIGSVILAVAALSAAAPAIDSVKRATLTENFLLFGSSLKSTAAANATALELVDPLGDPSFLLSMQVGYTGSSFNISQGVLQTLESPPHPYSDVAVYNSHVNASGSVLFLPGNHTQGLFGFANGFLAFAGDTDHWTQCDGPFETPVINYKGSGPSCTRVYVFQKAAPPEQD